MILRLKVRTLVCICYICYIRYIHRYHSPVVKLFLVVTEVLSTKQLISGFPMQVLLSAPKLCLLRKGGAPLASRATGGPVGEVTLLLQDSACLEILEEWPWSWDSRIHSMWRAQKEIFLQSQSEI